MPSRSKAQARTMAAIAHGWKPPRGSKVADIPRSVAEEFAAADRKRGRPFRPALRKRLFSNAS